MALEAFALQDVSFAYPGSKYQALDHVDLSAKPGEFLTLFGPSGGGKSTLLRQLRTTLTPRGTRTGSVLFQGQPLEQVKEAVQSAKIGFVWQDPEDQIVTDKVWHELTFGLENLGTPREQMRARVAETAAFFGIESWFYRDVAQLSGGQKQLLNLASVMAMGPSLLVLDEPTSRLDPIAAGEFLSALARVNRELGVTVLLSEHRLEEALAVSDRVILLDGGRILCDAPPAQAGTQLREQGSRVFLSVPAPMRLWSALKGNGQCPVSVAQGRQWLEEYSRDHVPGPLPEARPQISHDGQAAVELDEVWFRYDKKGPDVLRSLSLKAWPGEHICILGGNGAGKSTAMALLAGLEQPQRGRVRRTGRVSALPQDPKTLFVCATLREEIAQGAAGLPRQEREDAVESMLHLCHLDHLAERHPYDLSGGEQQRAALARVLLTKPDVLLLDEPTKGLDAALQRELGDLLQTLTGQGVCILTVSHDPDFCARYADRCLLVFDGQVVSEGAPREFFSGNCFYTTSASRMARDILPQAVTVEDCAAAFGHPMDVPRGQEPPAGPGQDSGIMPPTLPAAREGAAPEDSGALSEAKPEPVSGGDSFKDRADVPLDKPEKRSLSRRSRLGIFISLLLIPLTIWLGIRWGGDRKYYLVSLLVILESCLPFFLAFEGRKPKARELVLLAALCALGVAGRAAFAALPDFKPVMALVILSGAALGGETGFLMGAMTMLTSNLLFGQGPWTPWQMFAMGLTGLLAGLFFHGRRNQPGRAVLCLFGALCALIIYGGLLNPASVLMAQSRPTWQMFLTAYAAGLPADLVHAGATAFFLWLLSRPMLEKLERMQQKYGLLETDRDG